MAISTPQPSVTMQTQQTQPVQTADVTAKALPQTIRPAAQMMQQPIPTQTQQPASTSLSPNEIPTKLDVNDIKTILPFLGGSGSLPASLSVADMPKVLQYLQAHPGYSGKESAGEIPKGYDPSVNYDGFVKGQCTSYASWYMNNVLGKKWYDSDPGKGDAKNWIKLAKQQGYNVSTTPQPGSVVSWPSMGQHGHVAVVKSVNQDGSINVSEFNYKPGKYSERTNVSTSGAYFIY